MAAIEVDFFFSLVADFHCGSAKVFGFNEKEHFYTLTAERQEREIIELKWKLLLYEEIDLHIKLFLLTFMFSHSTF